MSENYTPRLKTRYREEIKNTLNEEFKYDNVMQIPGVVKVVVNMGVGDAARDSKLINGALEDLTKITGQKPQVRRARKSIANFKLREGMPIGARVTLRGDRMWEFLDRLLTIALPRIRDFRGLSDRQFDGLRSLRAVHVLRDRHRLHRPPARHGHHGCHHRHHGRGRPPPAQGARLPVQVSFAYPPQLFDALFPAP